MNPFMDAKGFPVTSAGDGGDSAAQWGNVMAINPNFAMSTLAPKYFGNETPVRHPDKSKWYGLDWRFSRDQLVPFICGLIGMKRARLDDQGAGKKLFQMHSRRGFVLAWNKYRNHVYPDLAEHNAKATPDVLWRPEPKFPDFTGPEVWALWLRLFLESRRFFLCWPIAWLVLNVLDLETLIGSIHWRYREDRVTRNHLLVSIVARASTPTLVSWVNFRVCNFEDLINRWDDHCEATGELNTAGLFFAAVEAMRGWR